MTLKILDVSYLNELDFLRDKPTAIFLLVETNPERRRSRAFQDEIELTAVLKEDIELFALPPKLHCFWVSEKLLETGLHSISGYLVGANKSMTRYNCDIRCEKIDGFYQLVKD